FSIFQHIFFVALFAFAPFFFAGIFLTATFRLFSHRSSKVYAADLMGAAVGSVLAIFVLKLGGINANLLLAALAVLPGVLILFNKYSKKLKKIAVLFLLTGLFTTFLLNYLYGFLGEIPFAKGAYKDMDRLLTRPESKTRVLESRWSAFGRTDLVVDEEDPDEMIIFVDGGAGSAMYRFDGDPMGLDSSALKDFPGYFPLKLLSEEEKEKVLIIGSGGGREVLVSLLGGAKEITAVEVNKDLVDLMQKYSNYNGGIYNGFPGVKVVVEEGRNFIRSTREKYDLIILSIPITKTSRSPEGFALTENFLFTVESINDYLDRLRADGRLVVVAHNDMEIFRLVNTSLAALTRRGVDSETAMKHFYTLGSDIFPVFVLKKSPLSAQEAETIHLNLHEDNYTTLTSYVPYIEQIKQSIPLDEGFYYEHYILNKALYLMYSGYVSSNELSDIAGFDLRAVTDNDPFFYKFEIGLPSVITFLLLLSSIALVVGCFFKPISIENESPRNKIRILLLFSFLGVGFMLIEIPLFQKFILFLGQPVYSVAVLLFSLFIGAGIGSWISGFLWGRKTLFKLRLAAMIVGWNVVIYVLFLEDVFDFFLGTSFFTRIVISILLLMPLGFFMGMPFPLGIKLLDESDLKQHVPRMWGVNGIGSVLGSTLAIALAISLGFTYSMLAGALLYMLIPVFLPLNFNRNI
ncbi:MAG: spermine/spermidine synthase domain-containing protein, partial [Planctomycetota bacterium]